MKVAIDIRRISHFGVGTYIRNVIRTLARLDRQTQYLLISPPERLREFQELPPNFLRIPYALEQASPRDFLHFRNIVRRHRPNVVHVPHLFWVPLEIPCPYVMTVHDLLEHLYPQFDHNGFRHWLRGRLTGRALRKAARIFAVSNTTAADVSRLFHIPARKLEVTYNAIDDRFLQGHATDAEREFVAERYQVNYPFLLYAGNIRPHKNIGRIIEAFSALRTELAKEGKYDDLKLIIIGDELSKHPDLRRTVVKGGVERDVRFLGFVPIDVLRIFYDTARVFVFPSLYEGFGLPPLEAMAHGTPVVTSNVSSLPEVVGNAAVLVNPENVFEIMRALHRVLLDEELRQRLRQRAALQVQRYSWEESARRILAAYHDVAQA